MTTQTENQPKKIPAYYIFEKSADGNNIRVGAAFKHGKGTGFNVLIGDKRYTAFAPRQKS
jgi:hypothetical protein